jgi:hypothetical protein
MEQFRQTVKQLYQRQAVKEKFPSRGKRSLQLVMLDLLVMQLDKHATIAWQYRTVLHFGRMYKEQSSVRECWAKEEWRKWYKLLMVIRQQLPPQEGIPLAA